MDHHMMRFAAGGLGGILGTAFMQESMKLTSKLPESLKPAGPNQDPGDFIVQQGEKALGHPLSEKRHGLIAHALHWAYGSGWGALLGALAPALHIRKVSHAVAAGAGLGAVVWAAGYLGWLPATHLARPITQHRPLPVAMSLLSHVVYGAIVSIPLFAVGLLERRRSRGGMMRSVLRAIGTARV